jgi:NACalpha-BTF3-like transcription factor
MSDSNQQTQILTESEEKDILLIIEQTDTKVPRSDVVSAFLKNGKDIVNTILELAE